MKYFYLILFFSLKLASANSQEISDFLPKEPPRNSKENTKYLFAGLGLQVAGIGVTAGSVYIITDAWEEDLDLAFSGIGLGLVMTAAGTVLIVGSIANIASTRHSWREYKKARKHTSVSFQIEPTHYGIGIVCRF